MVVEALDRLAALFTYPQGQGLYGMHGLAEELGADCPEAGAALARCADAMANLPLAQQQELYVRTFEMNPLCSLEVGWQLYGEHYERGTFLVRMRRAMRELKLRESAELPDHLTHVLEIVGRLPEEQQGSFAAETLQPALAKMYKSLDEADNPYRYLLQATRSAIEMMAARTPQEVDHER
jgi:nitrate reductase molybdenum cofactor assembly chaperone